MSGRSDSDYAKCPATRRSVSGHNVRLEGAVVICKSGMQRTTTLSVTEAEKVAAVTCIQDMMFVKNIIESMKLEVELPMRLEIDNQGAVDLVHNFSVGGRTKHMEIRLLWKRELKEKGVLDVQWISGDNNETDIQTKNTSGPVFNKHSKAYCGEDEYS